MTNRRRFLKSLPCVPLTGLVAANGGEPASAVSRDYFAELNLTQFINAAEPYTRLCGALMPPEVVESIVYASTRNVKLPELHDAIGARLASLIGCEAAMVTAGAASGVTLGTAACITGTDPELVRRLPDVSGLKDEIIIQKSHRYSYDQAARNCGIRLVEVETQTELEHAINERTAMMLFNNTDDPKGQIKVATFARLGKRHGIPTLDDCAADVPPAEHLSSYLDLGFDLVVVSGGKGIRGPQNAGLLLGRKDLIEAARLNAPPNSIAIGRGMKVSKEIMLAMMVAVEQFLERDHEADWREWENRVKLIADTLGIVEGVQTEMFAPPLHYHVPHLRVRWDASVVKISPPEVVERLEQGSPAIELRFSPPNALELGVWMLRPGEDRIVAERILEILKAAA